MLDALAVIRAAVNNIPEGEIESFFVTLFSGKSVEDVAQTLWNVAGICASIITNNFEEPLALLDDYRDAILEVPSDEPTDSGLE